MPAHAASGLEPAVAAWREALRGRIARQSAIYAAGVAAASLLGAAAQVILARSMGVDAFAAFAFALAFAQLLAILFEFGLFVPAARLAANAEVGKQRQISAAALLAYLPVGALFSVAVFGASFAVDAFSSVDAGGVLRTTAPLAFVVPFPFVAQMLCQGVDRLHLYSIGVVASQLLFLAALVLLLSAEGTLTAQGAFAAKLATIGIGGLAIVALLRPAGRASARLVRRLVEEARRYGFGVYVGRVLSVGTYNLDVVLIAAFAEPKEVALYVVARSAASVVSLPVIGLANALFPRMARQTGLDRRWLRVSWLLAGGLALLAAAAGPEAIPALFGDAFSAAASVLAVLAAAEAIRAVTSIYNSYLAAQGRGRELRRAGFVLAASNVVTNLALIPPLGAIGAALASLIALLANLWAHVVGYRRSLRSPAARERALRAEPVR